MRSVLSLRNLFRNLSAAASIRANTTVAPLQQHGKGIPKTADLFAEILPSGIDPEKLDWAKVKEAFIKSSPIFKRDNVNSILIMNFTEKSANMGKNFIRFLKKNEPMNLGTVGNVFKFYYVCHENNNLDDNEKDHILELYGEIKSKLSVINPTTMAQCIIGLSLTKEWRECLSLFEKLVIHGFPQTIVCDAIIKSCFRNNEPEIGMNFINKLLDNDRTLDSTIYASWIDYCVRNFKDDRVNLLSLIEKMFTLIMQRGIIIDETSAKLFREVFINLGWKGQSVRIYGRVQCPACKNKLKAFELSEGEYKKLKESFYKEVMVGKNVFIKSNPEEIQLFTKFVDATSPYDIVIDGLNTVYCVTKSNKTKTLGSLILMKLVKYLLLNGFDNILILGRKHMMRWNRKHMDFLQNNVKMFLVDDMSFDDTFLLYAALSSSKTYFISRDFMRSHSFLMNVDRGLFKKWQEMHQYMVQYIDPNNDKVQIQEPLSSSPYAQKDVNWHIPYIKKGENIQFLRMPTNWLCLSPK